MTRIGRLAFWMLCGILVLAATAAPAQEYEIRWHEPLEVGDTYEFSSTGLFRQAVKVTMQDSVVQDQNTTYSIALDGKAEVQSVDDRGLATSLKITVSKLTRTTATGDPEELLPVGSVMIAKREGGHGEFSLADGAPLSLPAQELDALIDVEEEGFPSAREIFGTDKPRKVGDSWPVNTEAAAEAIRVVLAMPDYSAGNVSGEVRLLGIRDVDGVPCLELASSLTARKITGPMQGMQAQMKVQKGEVSFGLNLIVPVAAGKGKVSEEFFQGAEFVMEGESETPSAGLKMAIDSGSKVTRKYTYPSE